MVDYTYVYHPGIQKLAELVSSLGPKHYIQIDFANYQPWRTDISAFHDWLPHPVSILMYYFGEVKPISSFEVNKNTAYANLRVDNTPIRVTVSFEMTKQRKIEVVCEGGTALLDEVNFKQEESVRWLGTDLHPAVPSTRPLTAALSHFAECIAQDSVPITNLKFASEVVRVIGALKSWKF